MATVVRNLLIVLGLAVLVSVSHAQELTGLERQHWIKQELEKDSRVKILNNFCWELFDQDFDATMTEVVFHLPVDRWIFIQDQARSTANKGEFRVDDEATPIAFRQYQGRGEAMRHLKAGSHRLKFAAPDTPSKRRVIVRAVPSIHYAYFGAQESIISTFEPYDWQFLERYVNPHVNVMVALATPPADVADAWKQSGRRWLTLVKAMFEADRRQTESEDLERLETFWGGGAGTRNAYANGILVDEIGANNAYYDLFRKAAEQLVQDGSLKGRSFNTYGYGSGMADTDAGRAFGHWVVQNGGEIAVELYLMDTPDLGTAEKKIKNELIGGMNPWIKALPIDGLIATLCSCNQPAENANRNPGTDFNVFLDMQMQALAKDPGCFALGGVQMYYAAYSDEEVLRWIGKLYRHYCLEGSTQSFSQNSYELNYIVNPDFSNGAEGWTLDPAEEGLIAAKSFKGHGVLQSRWGASGTGDTFMWMRRSAKKANRITQEIRNLTPGRFYSLKLLSGDYKDLTEGRSAKKWPPVFTTLTGAELMTAPRQPFVYAYPHSFGRTEGAFTPANQYWNNYHWQVFRATAPTATLTISDWKDDDEKGGPIGQEAAFNFVEVQPYLEEK